MSIPSLELADWRRRVNELYAAVRASDPERAHAIWRSGRDGLFRDHPQTPLLPDDPLRGAGLPYWPYEPTLRFEVPLAPASESTELSLPTDGESATRLLRVGSIELPPLGVQVDVWRLVQYGGGLFLPLRDGTAGRTSYGGGRYLLDTAKGADLGGRAGTLVVDLNFL